MHVHMYIHVLYLHIHNHFALITFLDEFKVEQLGVHPVEILKPPHYIHAYTY